MVIILKWMEELFSTYFFPLTWHSHKFVTTCTINILPRACKLSLFHYNTYYYFLFLCNYACIQAFLKNTPQSLHRNWNTKHTHTQTHVNVIVLYDRADYMYINILSISDLNISVRICKYNTTATTCRFFVILLLNMKVVHIYIQTNARGYNKSIAKVTIKTKIRNKNYGGSSKWGIGTAAQTYEDRFMWPTDNTSTS